MKVGDIVCFPYFKKDLLGIILETGVYTGNKDILVMWQDGEIFPEKSKQMKVVRETR
jgi:hypothetical protein